MRTFWLISLLACPGTRSEEPELREVEAPASQLPADGVPAEFGAHASSIGRSMDVDRSLFVSKPDIVVVVIDTLRADHLGLYGHSRETSPHIDALGSNGVWFSRAYAHSGWTLPSFTSLFSGLLPHQHQVGRDRRNVHLFGRLSEEVDTLAELLGAHGYRTGAVLNNTFLAPEFGLNQGFDEYDWEGASNVQHRSAEETVSRGMAWLSASETPSFLVLHFMEPHANYAPREAVRHRFAGVAGEEPPIPVPFTFEDGQAEERLSPEQQDYLRRLYDEEIADADQGVGRLVESLEAQGVFSDTVVIVTADHGEEFWDHDGFEHGHQLFGELTRVPLVIHGPGLHGGEVDVVVEHLDLFETILDLGGVQSPVPAGESLIDLLDLMDAPGHGALLARRTAISDNVLYGPPRLSIVDYDVRLTIDQGASPMRGNLWRVAPDGGELELITGPVMHSETERIRQRLIARRGDMAPIEIDAEQGFQMDNFMVLDQLRSLGYLEH